MATSNVDIISGLYDAFDRGDIAPVLAGMHPRIEWNEAENFPYADRSPYVGPQAVAEGLFQRLADEWEYWNLTGRDSVEATNGQVIVTGRYQAKHKSSGRTIDAQFAHFWWVEGGKVTRFQQYADTEQVSRVMRAG